ncbi:MAG: hypothetical protein U5K28_09530 [Halobacteriales archaeon]|nr:hypothetical protein [Halobacteriales archaeon]
MSTNTDIFRRRFLSLLPSVMIPTALAGCSGEDLSLGQNNQERHNVTIINENHTQNFEMQIWGVSGSKLVDKSVTISTNKVTNFVFSGSPGRITVITNENKKTTQWPAIPDIGRCNEKNPVSLITTLGPHGRLFLQFGCEHPYEGISEDSR